MCTKSESVLKWHLITSSNLYFVGWSQHWFKWVRQNKLLKLLFNLCFKFFSMRMLLILRHSLLTNCYCFFSARSLWLRWMNWVTTFPASSFIIVVVVVLTKILASDVVCYAGMGVGRWVWYCSWNSSHWLLGWRANLQWLLLGLTWERWVLRAYNAPTHVLCMQRR